MFWSSNGGDQTLEHNLAKVGVVSSNLIARSSFSSKINGLWPPDMPGARGAFGRGSGWGSESARLRRAAACQQIRHERRARAEHEQRVGFVHLGVVVEHECVADAFLIAGVAV